MMRFGVNVGQHRQRPRRASNPVILHLKSTSGVYQNDDFTNAATADNDPVKSWAGQAGTASDAVETTNYPVLKTGTAGPSNSRASLRFDGDKQLVINCPEGAHSSFSCYMVVKVDSSTEDEHPLSLGDTAAQGGYMFVEVNTNDPGGGQPDNVDIGFGFSDDERANATNLSEASVWKLWAFTVNGTNHSVRFWLNGVEVTVTPQGDEVSLSLALEGDVGKIGNFTGGTHGTFHGNIAEIYVRRGVLPDVTWETMLAAVVSDWAIT